MINQEIIDYIKSELAKGVNDDAVKSALLQAGWKQEDIDLAFTSIKIAATNATVSNTSPINIINSNSAPTVTESNYPITAIWIFKYPILMVLASVIAILFDYWFPYFLIAIPYFLIANPLIKKNFHFALEKEYLFVKQGVLSKKQRNLPYGVIQNVLVKQDIFDRLFGIAALTIENASEAGGSGLSKWFSKSKNQQNQADFIGSQGNKVSIPGLKKIDAEALKEDILAKMKEFPLQDTQSGL